MRRFVPSLPFLLIGGSNAVLTFVVYRSLLTLLGGPQRGRAALAQGVAYAVAAVSSYVLNRRFSFGDAPHSGRAAVRFGLAQGSALLLSAALTQLFVALFGTEALHGSATLVRHRATLAWIVATGLVTFYNFNVMRRWVFGGTSEGAARSA